MTSAINNNSNDNKRLEIILEVITIRVKVRSVVDTDKQVNLKELKPADKIIAGFVSQWHQTKFYKNMMKRESEQEFARLTKMDEQLKETILAYVHAELNRNTSLAQHDTKCTEIVLSINAKYKDSLGRIMKHKDFISFNLELIEESSDMRKAFSNMPILIKISKKVVGGDD